MECDCNIILYDDHRTILNILYYAKHFGLFGQDVPTIVSFDRHDDACEVNNILEKIMRTKEECFPEMNEQYMWQFTEFGLSGNDDNWVRAGMELGLIKHYIGLGHVGSDATNIKDGFEKYLSFDNETHHLYSNGHLSEILSDGSSLSQQGISSSKGSNMQNDLHFHNGHFDDIGIKSLVLDIDLDCFTIDFADNNYACPVYIFEEHYVKNLKVKFFMDQLIKKTSLITICREQGSCGGLGESTEILKYIDYYWLNNSLSMVSNR